MAQETALYGTSGDAKYSRDGRACSCIGQFVKRMTAVEQGSTGEDGTCIEQLFAGSYSPYLLSPMSYDTAQSCISSSESTIMADPIGTRLAAASVLRRYRLSAAVPAFEKLALTLLAALAQEPPFAPNAPLASRQFIYAKA